MNVPRRILHVDDDPEVTGLVGEYLKDRGYESIAIHDPRQVIQRLPRYQERVVLLDIDMPHINGLELLPEIKKFDGGIQVVMLTGLVTMTSVLQSLRWGAEACLFKPLTDVEPLFDALDACHQKLERWWHTLDELTRRRKAESVEAAECGQFS